MAGLLESVSDAVRVAALLRADGASNAEVAAFLNVSERRVRDLVTQAGRAFPDLLDGVDDSRSGRLYRLCYLVGLQDAGVPVEEQGAWLDSLEDRAKWIRAQTRMRRTSDAAAD